MVVSKRNTKDTKTGSHNLNLGEEQSSLLCCNKDPIGCSFSGFTNKEGLENAIDYLASILAEAYRAIHYEQPEQQ